MPRKGGHPKAPERVGPKSHKKNFSLVITVTENGFAMHKCEEHLIDPILGKMWVAESAQRMSELARDVLERMAENE